MIRRFLIAFIIVIGLIIFGIWEGAGKITWLISLPALILMIVPAIVLTLASYSLKEFFQGFRLAFSKKTDPDITYGKYVIMFQAMRRYAYLAGVMATFLGILIMMVALNDTGAILSGTATALITLFYALILDLTVLLPFKTTLQKKEAE